jgi:type I restriction enzyme S subunit
VEVKESGHGVQPPRRFKAYPKYKDSGVEWLGAIPAHWGLKRLKRIAEFQGGGTPSKDNLEYWGGDIPWVSPKDMKVSVVVDTEDKITPQAVRESATKVIPAGAVLLVVRSGILVHSIPVALAGREVTLNQDLKALIPRSDLVPEYLFSLISGMQTEFLVEWKREGATVESLEINLVAQTQTPLPSEREQRAIVAFLHRETARIDELVAKKERLILLLQEKRAALITRAVTKGLDPNVPMKNSGVEGLGRVPNHWEVLKVTWLFSIGSGTTPTSGDPTYYDGEVPWITTSELREGIVRSTQKMLTRRALRDFSSLKLHPQGSVAVAMYGATIGRLGILGIAATVNQACCVFSSPKGIDPFFWFYWLQMRRPYLVSLGYGGGQPNLSQDLLRSIRLPTPPDVEQRAIVAFLDREMARIDALVARIRNAIDGLNEFRTALISAAVTGRIDVRGEAA